MPFSFLNAAILTGIAAGALPILIHLFSRRRVAKIPFSSLRFLEQISRRRVKRIRLTQWIILALRVLAIALLALALGRPAFRGDFVLGKSRGQSAVAIVLDRSLSMGAEGSAETLWQRARERTEELLRVLEPKDRVFFVGTDPVLEEIDAYPDPQAARDALRIMEVGYGVGDLAAGIRRAASVLGETAALNKELFVVSDFQRSELIEAGEAGSVDLAADLDPSTRVFLLPVDEGPLANTVLEDARAEGTSLDQRVRALVHRFGSTPVEDLSVTVESGAEVLGEAAVSVGGGARQAGEVPLTRLPGSNEAVRARIARDILPADDVRYVPPLGAGRIVTAVVQDPAQPSPFLPLALDPGGDGGRFDVRRITPDRLGRRDRRGGLDLRDIQLLVLDNVGYLPRDGLQRLRQWRAAGGMLFISLGDRVDLRFYNEDLLPALFPGVTLGNLLGTDEATATSYSLTPRAPTHATFTGFDAKLAEPITGARFWQVVEVKSGPAVRTLAEFGPGLPALIQGDGALLFASSLDGRWNNFPTHSAFLPLLHQGLEAMLRERGGELATVGERIEGVVDRSQVPPGTEVICRGPEGIELAVTTAAASRGLLLRSAPARLPGFYTVSAGGRDLFRRAVNVDPAESDLTPLDHDAVRALFPGEKTLLLEMDSSLRSPVREARYGREFWKEIVALVLLLAIVESWLARRGVA